MAARAVAWTRSAFCWVTWSISAIAWLIWMMPPLCSSEADEISPMMSLTRVVAATTASMADSACCTTLAPAPISFDEPSISTRISLAASALRPARLRTSPATTAKPRPCSPARAASTEALSARMLVWKAMESMTSVISAIFRELSVIRPMVATTSCISSPVSRTRVAFSVARPLAWRALSVFCCTVVVISSMLDAVCCSEAACCSVRDERSSLPTAISRAAGVTTRIPE